jgi:hypothetical protein
MSALRMNDRPADVIDERTFMSHRIREGMRPAELSSMGGGGKIVEADET